MKSNEIKRHDVFISYSRKNVEFARHLERALRAYRPPKEVDRLRPLRVFRDESDFTGTDYVRAIREHLAASRKLVVVCSPEAVGSPYVDDEIAQFVELNGAENVVPVLFSGLPNNEVVSGQESRAAFPPNLMRALEMPLAVDYRGYAPGLRNRVRSGSFGDRWYSLLANLYDQSRSEIERRESRRRARVRRYWITGLTAVSVSLLALTVWALLSRAEAIRERRIAVAREVVVRAKALQTEQTEVAERKALLAAEALFELRSAGASASEAEATLAEAMSRLPMRALEIAGGPEPPAVAFSGDGLTLFHAAGDRLSSWNLRTGQLQREAGLRAPAVELIIGPRRDVIAVCDATGEGELRSVDDLSVQGAAAVGAGLDPPQCVAALAGEEEGLVADPPRVGSPQVDPGASLLQAAERSGADPISPDGELYVTRRSLPEDPYVPLLKTSQLEIRRRSDDAKLAEVPGGHFQFTRDSSALLTERDGLVRFWSVSTGREIYRFEARQPPATILESPGGRYLALTAEDGSVDVWDIGHPQELVRTAPAPFAALSPDGALLATGGEGWLVAIDLRSARVVARIPFDGAPTLAGWSPSGRYLAVEAERNRFLPHPEPRLTLMLDLERGGEIVWTGSDIHDMAFAPDDKTFFLADSEGALIARSLPNGALSWELSPTGTPVSELEISKDGGKLLAVLASTQWVLQKGPLLIIDVRSGTELHRLESHGVTARTISGSGRLVAYADGPNSVRVVELSSSRTLLELAHPETLPEVFDLAFLPGDPDETRLSSLAGNAASGFLPGTRFYTEQAAFVWDLAGGAMAARVPPGTDEAVDYRTTLEEEDKPYPVDLRLGADGSAVGGTVFPSRGAYWGVFDQYVSKNAVVWDLQAPEPTEVLRLPDRELLALAEAGDSVLARGPESLEAWSTDRSGIEETLCRRVSRDLSETEQETYLSLSGKPYRSPCRQESP